METSHRRYGGLDQLTKAATWVGNNATASRDTRLASDHAREIGSALTDWINARTHQGQDSVEPLPVELSNRYHQLQSASRVPNLENDPPLTPVTHPGEVLIIAAAGVAPALVDALCFPANTPICSNGVEIKPIQSIQVGDSVQSYNADQNRGECRQVKAVAQRTTNHLFKFKIAGRTLRTTDEHPFYVVTKRGYLPAHKLRRGDALKSVSGKTVFLEEITDEDGEFTVYNLQVDEFANYYAADVLVHNCNFEARRERAAANLGHTEPPHPQQPPGQPIEQRVPDSAGSGEGAAVDKFS